MNNAGQKGSRKTLAFRMECLILVSLFLELFCNLTVMHDPQRSGWGRCFSFTMHNALSRKISFSHALLKATCGGDFCEVCDAMVNFEDVVLRTCNLFIADKVCEASIGRIVRISTCTSWFDPRKSVVSVFHCFWSFFAALSRCVLIGKAWP